MPMPASRAAITIEPAAPLTTISTGTIQRRTALLACLSIPLGSWNGLARAQGGWLRIPLDQWLGLIVEHKGKSITITAADIFAALEDR